MSRAAMLMIGLFLGACLQFPQAQAIRIPRPPTIVRFDEATAAQLNTWLESIWQLANGRYTKDVVTANPNGSQVGTNGDEVYFNAAGSYKHCVNTTATTASSPTGTTWRCSANAYTAP